MQLSNMAYYASLNIFILYNPIIIVETHCTSWFTWRTGVIFCVFFEQKENFVLNQITVEQKGAEKETKGICHRKLTDDR